MIPYDLIIASASRPHLLRPVLTSLLSFVDQLPQRVIVHDDAAFPGRQETTLHGVGEVCGEFHLPGFIFHHDDPPLLHGPSLHWLLSRVSTEFCLYSQDDHEVVRPLPISKCLEVMKQHQLQHVRFNKRATMGWKGNWQKQEVRFPMPDGSEEVLTISDHWYFQTSLWRVERIRWIVNWFMAQDGPSFREHCEFKVNHAFNRRIPEINRLEALGQLPFPLPPSESVCMDPEVRREVQRTFIWGPIGDDKYIDHIGGDPKDWALLHGRGGVGIRDSQGPVPARWCDAHQQVCTHV